MKTSVLICTYNRGDLINGTLDSLINHQTKLPDEIVVVNGGGTHDCSSLLLEWKSIYGALKIIDTKNVNLANSRNIGIKNCKGDIIIETDDDARPFNNWVEKMIEGHTKFPNAGGIGGNVIDSDGKSFLSRIADVSTFPASEKIKNIRNIPGVNVSYKKKAMDSIGDYDISLFRGEDVDYNWRLIQNGWDIVFIPDVKVIHIHRPTWRGLFFQHYMYGRAYYLVRKKWSNMYCVFPMKNNSIKAIFKNILSWTLVPMFDAFNKSVKMENNSYGFGIIVLYFLNISNRFGAFVQKNFY